MSTQFTIIFSLLSIIHGICSLDWNDDMGNINQYPTKFRERRGLCSNPVTKTSEKYFFRMYYNAASFKGRITKYHDTINFRRPKIVTGWTIQGKAGKTKGISYRQAGILTEYVVYYRTGDGLWKHFVNKDTGNKVFSADGGLDSPKTVTKVRLDKPVRTSSIRLYPKNYEGFPYMKIKIQICPGGSSRHKERKSTTTTSTTTTIPTTTTTTATILKPVPVIKKIIASPVPTVDMTPKVPNYNLIAAIKRVKDLHNELKALELEKKEIEKEIKMKEGIPLIRKDDTEKEQKRYILY